LINTTLFHWNRAQKIRRIEAPNQAAFSPFQVSSVSYQHVTRIIARDNSSATAFNVTSGPMPVIVAN
jgi:hypothetical protein